MNAQTVNYNAKGQRVNVAKRARMLSMSHATILLALIAVTGLSCILARVF